MSRDQLITAAAIGTVLWGAAAYGVNKLLPSGAFDENNVTTAYALNIPLSCALAEGVQRAVGVSDTALVATVAAAAAPALLLDGLGIAFAPETLYGGKHEVLAKPAAHLMFGVGVSLAYALTKASLAKY
jgi:hypothetical protein